MARYKTSQLMGYLASKQQSVRIPAGDRFKDVVQQVEAINLSATLGRNVRAAIVKILVIRFEEAVVDAVIRRVRRQI